MKISIFFISWILISLFIISCVKIEPRKVVPLEFKEGQRHFHRVCANCHGADVMGSTKAPKLIQEKYYQVDFPNRKIKSTILNGSTSGSMPSQKHRVSEKEIKEVIKYIRYVQKESRFLGEKNVPSKVINK